MNTFFVSDPLTVFQFYFILRFLKPCSAHRWRSCLWCRDMCTAHLSTQWGSTSKDSFVMFIFLMPCSAPRWRSCLWCRDMCTAHLSTQWGSRWLVVRDTFVMYISPDTGKQVQQYQQHSTHNDVVANSHLREYSESATSISWEFKM